jgi:His-Xaa-Ser system radical SAM maturase HxsB
MPHAFQPLAFYRAAARTPYRLLPFRFLRWSSDEVLLTNDAGEWLFLADDAFRELSSGRLSPDGPAYADLKSRHFLTDSASVTPVEMLAAKYRLKKGFLEGFTRLHLFVVTLRCDHSCAYCQVSRVTQDRGRFDMTEDTAKRAVDLMFESPSPAFKVEFQGGEPLLNFELIRWIVCYAQALSRTRQRPVEFVVATNLALLTDDMLAFFADHTVCLSTSLDGPAFLHNRHRPRPGGDSHEIFGQNLARAREALGVSHVSALMTTTEHSLGHPHAIVDEYARLGFETIFLRPISPYGFAARSRASSRYDADLFLHFYKAALGHVIELNRAGRPMVEIYAQILLRKILTPFPTGYVDLQSPAGAGIAAVVYNYDGEVYASDEGRMLAAMGDPSFRLGHVKDSFRDIFGGPLLHALVEGSCHETMPGCSECAFSPFCGADPVFNWATQRDPIGHRPTSAFCARNMGIIRYLFDILRSDDAFARDLLTRWATEADRPSPSARRES